MRRSRRRRKPLGQGPWLPEVVNDALYTVRRATGKMVEGTLETILDPVRAAGIAGEGVRATGVLGRLALMPSDPDTIFKGNLGTAKRCAWSKILPLDEVKAYSRSVGATINDVLLAGVAGAREHGRVAVVAVGVAAPAGEGRAGVGGGAVVLDPVQGPGADFVHRSFSGCGCHVRGTACECRQ